MDITSGSKLVDHVLSSELVHAAITEAVHRYYYDNVIDKSKDRDKENLQLASDLLSKLWNLYPNWRHILKEKSERYFGDNDTNAVTIWGKPAKELFIEFKLIISEKEVEP